MSSAAKRAANAANAQHSTGPRTEAGRATSSQNAVKSGLFSTSDFIRPGEEPLYTELDEALRADLAPEGQLEYHLVDEIRRAMWRSRRCGEVEASLVEMCSEIGVAASAANGDGVSAPIPDPMQNEATAKSQHSVDRARAQCHRLLHKCTAELRKLQTERQIRNETLEAGTDLTHLGLSDLRSVHKAIDEHAVLSLRLDKRDAMENAAMTERAVNQACAIPIDLLRFGNPATVERKEVRMQKPETKRTQPSRNARCTCGSGLKYKRCCGCNIASITPLPAVPSQLTQHAA